MSTTIEELKAQHEQLLELSTEITEFLSASILAEHSVHVRDLLDELARGLRDLVTTEQDLFYLPAPNEDSQVTPDTVERFQGEIDHLASGFSAYDQKWRAPESIEADSDEFLADTAVMLRGLAVRIDREKQELLPLLAG